MKKLFCRHNWTRKGVMTVAKKDSWVRVFRYRCSKCGAMKNQEEAGY